MKHSSLALHHMHQIQLQLLSPISSYFKDVRVCQSSQMNLHGVIIGE